MPHLLALGDTLKLTVYCQLGGQVAENVSMWRVVATSGASRTDKNFADDISSAFGPLYKAVMSVEANYRGVQVQKVNLPIADPQVSAAGAIAGAVAGDALSTQTAGLFRLRTGLGGRRFRGRKYIPFPSETDNDATARPEVAYLGNLAPLATRYVNQITVAAGADSATLAPGLWEPLGNTFTPFGEFKIVEDWATQRRRSQVNRGDGNPPV